MDDASTAYQFCMSNCYYLAGFAFVYFEDERDAEDAIRGLDNLPFGYDRRRLSVEWARVDLSHYVFLCPSFFLLSLCKLEAVFFFMISR